MSYKNKLNEFKVVLGLISSQFPYALSLRWEERIWNTTLGSFLEVC